MTRKDYAAIAKVVADHVQLTEGIRYNNDGERNMSLRAIQGLTAHLADLFVEQNPRFDRCRFVRACFPNLVFFKGEGE